MHVFALNNNTYVHANIENIARRSLINCRCVRCIRSWSECAKQSQCTDVKKKENKNESHAMQIHQHFLVGPLGFYIQCSCNVHRCVCVQSSNASAGFCSVLNYTISKAIHTHAYIHIEMAHTHCHPCALVACERVFAVALSVFACIWVCVTE